MSVLRPTYHGGKVGFWGVVCTFAPICAKGSPEKRIEVRSHHSMHQIGGGVAPCFGAWALRNACGDDCSCV
eukprot:521970-Pyramimonas_sp.AAC.1